MSELNNQQMITYPISMLGRKKGLQQHLILDKVILMHVKVHLSASQKAAMLLNLNCIINKYICQARNQTLLRIDIMANFNLKCPCMNHIKIVMLKLTQRWEGLKTLNRFSKDKVTSCRLHNQVSNTFPSSNLDLIF